MFHLWSNFNPKVIHMSWQINSTMYNFSILRDLKKMLLLINSCNKRGNFFTYNMSFRMSSDDTVTKISTQQESDDIYLYTTKFGTSIKIWLNRKFESTEFETMRVNCIASKARYLIINFFIKQLSRIKVLVPRCRKPYYLHSLSQIYLSKHVYYLGIKIGSQVKHPVIEFDIFTLGYFTCLFHNLSN
jgi:hypothetical protein